MISSRIPHPSSMCFECGKMPSVPVSPKHKRTKGWRWFRHHIVTKHPHLAKRYGFQRFVRPRVK